VIGWLGIAFAVLGMLALATSYVTPGRHTGQIVLSLALIVGGLGLWLANL
jgi:hypothetical protein